MLDLARAVQDAGHEVLFATGPDRHHLITGAGLQAVTAGMSAPEMVAERRRRWPETDRQPATNWATRMFTQVLAPTALHDLLSLVNDWQPQVVVHDEGEYAAPVAAAARGVPWVKHAWGSPLRPSDELPELEELTEPLWRSCGLGVPPAAGLYTHALVDPCPTLLQGDVDAADVVWPLRPRPLSGQGVKVTGDVYVGFGTVLSFAEAPIELEAAIRACTARGLKVVVTAPTRELREHLTAIDPTLVDAQEFVSLPHLLPTCSAVISHAGAGTVLASLGAGVPAVLVPRGSPSQMRMAEACHRAGVAIRCEPADIATAVDDLLDEPSIAAAAKSAACEMAAMPEACEIVPMIEAMVTA